MNKALVQIKEKQKLADVFLILLDARAPISSYNEEFDKIAPTKPRVFVLTKVDLADKSKLNKLMNKFNNPKNKVISVDLRKHSSKKKIFNAINQVLQEKKERDLAKGLLKPRLRAFVVGVPNSGKSTLINLLGGSSKAKTGNMPGVTRGQQWVQAGEVQLLDTPGILWPKFEDELVGIKLAIIGSIKLDIIQPMELFNEGFKLLSKYYPEKLKELGFNPTLKEKEIYNELRIMMDRIKTKDKNKVIRSFINKVLKMKGVTYDN